MKATQWSGLEAVGGQGDREWGTCSEGQLFRDSSGEEGSGRKEKVKQPLQDARNKGTAFSQVLISISQFKSRTLLINAK